MSDPYNAEVDGYIAPTDEELSARRKRSAAIGLGLGAFAVLVFFLMLYKIGVFS